MNGATENSKEESQDGVNTSDGVLSDLQRIATLLMNETHGAPLKWQLPMNIVEIVSFCVKLKNLPLRIFFH